jgi:phosphoglycerate dehydrogenase-like enzyme
LSIFLSKHTHNSLKAVARAGVGVDNVDLPTATANRVVVMNTPGGNTISTAEHTFGLMLALARHSTLRLLACVLCVVCCC